MAQRTFHEILPASLRRQSSAGVMAVILLGPGCRSDGPDAGVVAQNTPSDAAVTAQPTLDEQVADSHARTTTIPAGDTSPGADPGDSEQAEREGTAANSGPEIDDSAGGTSPAADTGEADTEQADTEPSDPEDTPADVDPSKTTEAEIKHLLARAIDLKTDDLEALGALDQAKRAGASGRRVAQSANRRGERLYSAPDRATKFFEWANRMDKRYAEPSFNLAKIAANQGELAQAKVHLREVAARRGHKLLQTIEFDPTFAVLADDPDIRQLWQQ